MYVGFVDVHTSDVLWRSEDNFVGLVLSSCLYVGSRDGAGVSGPGLSNKAFTY